MCQDGVDHAPTVPWTERCAPSNLDRNDSEYCPPGPRLQCWLADDHATCSGVSKENSTDSSQKKTDAARPSPSVQNETEIEPGINHLNADQIQSSLGFDLDAWSGDGADGAIPDPFFDHSGLMPLGTNESSPESYEMCRHGANDSFKPWKDGWVNIPHMDDQVPDALLGSGVDHPTDTESFVTGRLGGLSEPQTGPLPPGSGGYVIYSYYPFLEMDNLTELPPETVNFMETKHCFRIPTPEILDEFMQQYFLHVHPNVPMLDEGDFWQIYRQRGPGRPPQGRRISLLLLQAMLFASSSVSQMEGRNI